MSWACPLLAHGYGSVRPISQGPSGSFLSSSVSMLAQAYSTCFPLLVTISTHCKFIYLFILFHFSLSQSLSPLIFSQKLVRIGYHVGGWEWGFLFCFSVGKRTTLFPTPPPPTHPPLSFFFWVVNNVFILSKKKCFSFFFILIKK